MSLRSHLEGVVDAAALVAVSIRVHDVLVILADSETLKAIGAGAKSKRVSNGEEQTTRRGKKEWEDSPNNRIVGLRGSVRLDGPGEGDSGVEAARVGVLPNLEATGVSYNDGRVGHAVHQMNTVRALGQLRCLFDGGSTQRAAKRSGQKGGGGGELGEEHLRREILKGVQRVKL
ncbi:hypothetical protein NPX13_g8791 [Xylaria arbuscula]|uniref:Uncharacterized protein n=1 Tax=Xylaria arbuscula TaxID=114810 RepID=A0A9W8N837_9PEZI|nr:hypothetical protein NPX13_g8791 [Xylaria arbuscula]